MATLTATPISRAGINLTTLPVAATAGGDKWTGTGTEQLYVVNGTATACVVTLVFNSSAVVDGQVPPARTVSVPGNTNMIIGGFPAGLYNDANAFVNITYSQVASVKVQVIQFVTT